MTSTVCIINNLPERLAVRRLTPDWQKCGFEPQPKYDVCHCYNIFHDTGAMTRILYTLSISIVLNLAREIELRYLNICNNKYVRRGSSGTSVVNCTHLTK